MGVLDDYNYNKRTGIKPQSAPAKIKGDDEEENGGSGGGSSSNTGFMSGYKSEAQKAMDAARMGATGAIDRAQTGRQIGFMSMAPTRNVVPYTIKGRGTPWQASLAARQQAADAGLAPTNTPNEFGKSSLAYSAKQALNYNPQYNTGPKMAVGETQRTPQMTVRGRGTPGTPGAVSTDPEYRNAARMAGNAISNAVSNFGTVGTPIDNQNTDIANEGISEPVQQYYEPVSSPMPITPYPGWYQPPVQQTPISWAGGYNAIAPTNNGVTWTGGARPQTPVSYLGYNTAVNNPVVNGNAPVQIVTQAAPTVNGASLLAAQSSQPVNNGKQQAFKVGGYTQEEIERAGASPYTTGYNYDLNTQGTKMQTPTNVKYNMPTIAGYYLAPNGKYYPIDMSQIQQKKSWAYGGGGGGGGYGGGSDRNYQNWFQPGVTWTFGS